MVPFKIKNWLITEEGISWNGEPDVSYNISRDRLLELGPGDRNRMYDWLVHMPEKTWLTETDVYAPNTAFMYAAEYYGLGINTGSIIETLIEQQKILKEK